MHPPGELTSVERSAISVGHDLERMRTALAIINKVANDPTLGDVAVRRCVRKVAGLALEREPRRSR